MEVTICYNTEENNFCVYRGLDLVLLTSSYVAALKKFDQLCAQMAGCG